MGQRINWSSIFGGRGTFDPLPPKIWSQYWWIGLYPLPPKFFVLYWRSVKLPSLDLRAGLPRRAGKKYKYKMGLKGCKWSSLNAPGTETPLCHPFVELGKFPFLSISPLGWFLPVFERIAARTSLQAGRPKSEVREGDPVLCSASHKSIRDRAPLIQGHITISVS